MFVFMSVKLDSLTNVWKRWQHQRDLEVRSYHHQYIRQLQGVKEAL